MNNENKEKLIEIVRQYECIFNPKCKEYKNVSYKRLLWEKIGATLNIQGTKAKDAWRSLRDGYIRHKKTTKGQTGSSKKYSNYTWSLQMSFLDSTLELRPTSTNITPPQPGSDAPLSPSSIPRQSLPVERPSSPALMHSPPSAQPGPSSLYSEHEVDGSSQALETFDLPSSAQLQQPPTISLQPPPSPATRTTKKKTFIDNSDKVLDYLKNKKKREWDDADYLFMSYAKSFKKISVRNQGKIKVALAKLFADAELDDFDNNSTNEGRNQTTSQQASTLMYLSPAYSVISDGSTEVDVSAEIDGSTETILITEDHIQQTMQPVLISEETSHESDVFLAIDLTNNNSNESQ